MQTRTERWDYHILVIINSFRIKDADNGNCKLPQDVSKVCTSRFSYHHHAVDRCAAVSTVFNHNPKVRLSCSDLMTWESWTIITALTGRHGCRGRLQKWVSMWGTHGSKDMWTVQLRRGIIRIMIIFHSTPSLACSKKRALNGFLNYTQVGRWLWLQFSMEKQGKL